MAGQVFPSDGPRPTGSHAEKKLWAALGRYLPNGWRAWHSLRVRVAQDWEGEGDFVIADPQRGILILEVKGGNIELQGGRWLENGKPLAKAPRDQGQRFARVLAQELENRGAEVPPRGVACAFPDVAFSDAPTGDGLKGAVIGERELSWLGESITVLALEREQMQILDFAQDNKIALVEGGAGSGKTIVARELCVRTARAGELALYLCFASCWRGPLIDRLCPCDLTRILGTHIGRKADSVRREFAKRIRPVDPIRTCWTRKSDADGEIGLKA